MVSVVGTEHEIAQKRSAILHLLRVHPLRCNFACYPTVGKDYAAFFRRYETNQNETAMIESTFGTTINIANFFIHMFRQHGNHASFDPTMGVAIGRRLHRLAFIS
jgi:hypothetical protein